MRNLSFVLYLKSMKDQLEKYFNNVFVLILHSILVSTQDWNCHCEWIFTISNVPCVLKCRFGNGNAHRQLSSTVLAIGMQHVYSPIWIRLPKNVFFSTGFLIPYCLFRIGFSSPTNIFFLLVLYCSFHICRLLFFFSLVLTSLDC